jgi:hypothetical protein
MYPAHFISETISKDICAQLAREVVSLVPQVVDYTCAICESQALTVRPISSLGSSWLIPPPLGLSLCWLPIRLDCSHLFCIRCMIKMQNQNKRHCPLCRADVVQRANESMYHHSSQPIALTPLLTHRQPTSTRIWCGTSSGGSPRRPRRSRRTTRLNGARSYWGMSTLPIALLHRVS